MERLNPAFGIVGDDALIFVLRFSSTSQIEIDEFCDSAQEILYDEIGSTGHFRIAPASRNDLNENFVLGARSKYSLTTPAQCSEPVYMPRASNELFVSFIIRETSSDTPISQELSILPMEFADFCHRMHLTFEQVDVRELYS